MRRKLVSGIEIVLLILVVVAVVWGLGKSIKPTTVPKQMQVQIIPTETPAITQTAGVLGVRTKISGCQVNGPLPDKECTPGAVFANVTRDQICTKGYTATVRNVPDSLKQEIYAEYGIYSHTPGEYEVDHLISLELGGSNDPANLWPEAANPKPGFHEKDTVENKMNREVCDGIITLSKAQEIIANNWVSAY